jgi:hypothetical protein
MTVIAQKHGRASATRAQLRTFASRLASSTRPEFVEIAALLELAIDGESLVVEHMPPCTCAGRPCWARCVCTHDAGGACWLGCDACEHAIFDCEICLPRARLAWVVGVAFPNTKLGFELGLPKSAREDWAEEFFRRGADGALLQPAEIGMLLRDVAYHDAIAQLDRDHADNETIIRQIKAAACTRREQLKAFRKGKGVDPSWLL